MPKQTERGEILQGLRSSIKSGKPVLAAGCSCGLVAKAAELGGADLIIVYSTGKSRLMGLPTSRIGDSNAVTLDMCHELLNVVQDTPIIGGIEATDPTRMDLEKLLGRFLQAGYSGVINFPTIGIFDRYRKIREQVGFGFDRELELIKLARRQDVFTMAYVFSPEDAEKMAEAGVDCIVGHVGPTTGGLVGFTYEDSKEAAISVLAEILQAAKSINPDIIPLAHGGPFATPEDTRYLYENTESVGFVGASSIERIPLEKAVTETVKEFKSVPLGTMPRTK